MKRSYMTYFGIALIIVALALPFLVNNVPSTSLAIDYGSFEITANSGSAADIQTAVNAANAQGGGTVHVPAGTFHWNAHQVIIPAGVSLIGASPAGCSGHENNWAHYTATTILINDAAQPISKPMLILDGTGGKDKPSRISGLSIRAGVNPTSESTSGGSWGIETREAKNFRIDHCDVINFNHAQIAVNAGPSRWSTTQGHSSYGLIDHCFLDAPYKDTMTSKVAYGIDIFGNMQPARFNNWIPFHQGNYAGKYQSFPEVTLVIVEDCNFRRLRHSVDGANGYVATVRYSLWDHMADEANNLWSCGEVCQHPYWVDSQHAGCLTEAYNNRFVNTGTTGDPIPYPPPANNAGNMHKNCPRHLNQRHGLFANVIRGGSALIYSNEYYQPEPTPNDFGIFLKLRDESEGAPTGIVTETFIWDNDVTNSYQENGQPMQVTGGQHVPQLNIDYFLRAPNQAQDGWTYTPYLYPHPLVLGNEPPPPPPPEPFDVTIMPTSNGTITPAPNTYTYDSPQTLTLRAYPNSGYEFKYWLVNGAIKTSNPQTIEVGIDTTITAVITLIEEEPPIYYTVTVESSPNGTVTPVGSNMHQYPTVITVSATPNEGYRFDYWLINNEAYTDNPKTLTLSETTTIKAVITLESETPPPPPDDEEQNPQIQITQVVLAATGISLIFYGGKRR